MNAHSQFLDTLAAFTGIEQDEIPVFDAYTLAHAHVQRVTRAIQNGDAIPLMRSLPRYHVIHDGGGAYSAWANGHLIDIFGGRSTMTYADACDAARACVRAAMGEK